MNGSKKTFLGIEDDEVGSDMKQIGQEWHRVVPAEFQPFGEHSSILCFLIQMFFFFFFPSHRLLLK